MRCFRTRNLLLSKKCVPLHCVFHSIRFKVNKGWSTAVLLFLYPYISKRRETGAVEISYRLAYAHRKDFYPRTDLG